MSVNNNSRSPKQSMSLAGRGNMDGGAGAGGYAGGYDRMKVDPVHKRLGDPSAKFHLAPSTETTPNNSNSPSPSPGATPHETPFDFSLPHADPSSSMSKKTPHLAPNIHTSPSFESPDDSSWPTMITGPSETLSLDVSPTLPISGLRSPPMGAVMPGKKGSAGTTMMGMGIGFGMTGPRTPGSGGEGLQLGLEGVGAGLGSAGLNSAASEGAIAPWLQEDSMSPPPSFSPPPPPANLKPPSRKNTVAGVAAMAMGGEASSSSTSNNQSPSRKTSFHNMSVGNITSLASLPRPIRQRSSTANTVGSGMGPGGGALEPIAASPPTTSPQLSTNMGTFGSAYGNGNGNGNGNGSINDRQGRNGSYSSQGSAPRSVIGMFDGAGARSVGVDQGGGDSRRRVGSDDSGRTIGDMGGGGGGYFNTMHNRDHESSGGDGGGSPVSITGHKVGGGRGGVGGSAIAIGPGAVAGSAFGRTSRSDSKAFGNGGAPSISPPSAHDKSGKKFSGLSGLLKRKGGGSLAGHRPSTAESLGSDHSGNIHESPPQRTGGMLPTVPSSASVVRQPSYQRGRTVSANDPALQLGHSPSMVSLASYAPSIAATERASIAPFQEPAKQHKDSVAASGPMQGKDPIPKEKHSLRGNIFSRARKATRKNTMAVDEKVDGLGQHDHSRHSPEVQGHKFELDTDLDHMEGIIDLAKEKDTVPQSMYHGSIATSATSSGSGSASMSTLAGDNRRGTTTSTFSVPSSSLSGPGRALVDLSDQPVSFTRPNPFSGSGDSASNLNVSLINTPPSPHTPLAKQSVTSLGTKGQARRPSQLRNVKSNSAGSEDALQIAGEGRPEVLVHAEPQTVFNTDPFGTGNTPTLPSTPTMGGELPLAPALKPSLSSSGLSTRKGLAMHIDLMPARLEPGRFTSEDGGMLSPGSMYKGGFNLTPANETPPANVQAAWAAPESWGVEGDEIPPPGPAESSDDEADANGDTSLDAEQIQAIPSQKQAPPPFGFRSAERRGTTRPGSKAARPITKGSNRPGTGGSYQGSANHFLRVYNPDSTYTTMALPLTASVQDVLAGLASKEARQPGQPVKGNMKLYIRERGQDRQLSPHEKPLAIQLRRIMQAGYADNDRIEEMGRDNLAMLCRFIYQPPVLPVMDPEDENNYDSFELVDLGSRDLQTIPIFLYRHAHTIISLNLSKNPMAEIPLDFIQTCITLRELRMTHMALKRVPASIRQSSALTRLDLSCNRIADLEHAGLHEIETLVSLKIQNNRLSSLPADFKYLKSLKYLNISNNKFVNFPDVICPIQGLMDLDVSFNEITAFPAELCECSGLERLVAVGNSLTTFPDSFSRLANLRELDVRRNALTNLNAVYALPNLAILQADNNNLVVLDTQLGPKVREFSVPNNSITRFTLAPRSDALVTYSLAILDLSHAKLSMLADDALAQLVNLHTLNLNFNKFARLPDTIENLNNLRTLSCADNVLTALPAGLAKLRHLQVLNVHNNNLKELPSGIWQCRSLQILNASSNLLEAFPEVPFSMFDALAIPLGETSRKTSSLSQQTVDEEVPGGLPLSRTLRKLMLCDNQLDDEIFDSVAMMEELRVLNLSFNDIYDIPVWSISKNQHLEELYLSGNHLTTLPSEDLERLTSLRVIHLNGNKLQTLPAELGKIHRLVTLDVGSNVLKYNIANWPYDWNWNWNLELRYLNLSGNKRLEIKPTPHQEMGYGGNFRRDLSDFSKLTQLRVLGLMDVTLRIPSVPDESENRRVRTSFSEVNGMGYGISDTLGRVDNLAMIDIVVPEFRSREDECMFGMFGQAVPSITGGRVPKFAQEWIAPNLHAHLDKIKDSADTPEDALRRAFLVINKNCFDSLVAEETGRKDSASAANQLGAPAANAYSPQSIQYRSGASAGIVYLTGKTLYVANAGRTLAVISCKGEAELLSQKHDPLEKEEIARIRAAEAWVSPRGWVNDEIPQSRGFGFYQAVPALTSVPFVTKRTLTDADEFVILANRAMWDVCPYQTAVDIARTVKDDPMMAAQKLRDFAISYGAEGSILVMVLSVSDLFRQRPTRSRTMMVDRDAMGGDADSHYTKRAPRRKVEDIGDRTLLRLQQEVEPPVGRVAMVFTDIKNSTSLWETNPGMQTAMRMHNSLLRRQLRIIGGYEVKTEGDAFMVSFPSVTSAILWCFTCQQQLLTEDWPREILECEDGKEVYDSSGVLIARGLSVRMGFHWGNPVSERDPITRRMDYFGPMVNKSARVSASADGGQISISSDVYKEIQSFKGYLDEEGDDEGQDQQDDGKREVTQLRKVGLGILDLGEKKLKGLEIPERLFLIYPKSLAGRLEMTAETRKDAEAQGPKVYGGEERILNLDDLRQVSHLCLRLEAVAATISSPITTTPLIASPVPDDMSPGGRSIASAHAMKRSNTAQLHALTSTMHLGPKISEEMSNDELLTILLSLSARIENVLSTLVLKQLGDFLPGLSALGSTTGSNGMNASSILAALSAFAALKKDTPSTT